MTMHKFLLLLSLSAIGNQCFRLQPISVKSKSNGKEGRPKVQPYQALMPLLVALNPSPSNAFIVGPLKHGGHGSVGSIVGHAAVVPKEVVTGVTTGNGVHRHPAVDKSNVALEELNQVDKAVAKALSATHSGDSSMSAAGSDEQDEVLADAAAWVTRNVGKSVEPLAHDKSAAVMEEELEDAAAATEDFIEDFPDAFAGISIPEAAAVPTGGDKKPVGIPWFPTSATALHGPVRTMCTRRVGFARATPAMACLGKPHGTNDPLPELEEIKPTLSYDGWEQDAAVVADCFVRCGPSVASRQLANMRRKQQLHDGDRSDKVLQVLDEVKQGLTYDGWEKDVSQVERDWTCGWPTHIHKMRDTMRRKQRLHQGDRSDEVLQILDGVKQKLTYPGWETDAGLIEEDWIDGNVRIDDIEDVLETMRRKQQLHDGDRFGVSVLHALDEVKQGLTYPGWDVDVRQVEHDWAAGYVNKVGSIEEELEKMRLKQLEYLFKLSVDGTGNSSGA